MKKTLPAVISALLLAASTAAAVQAEKPKPCPTRDAVVKSQAETAVSLLRAVHARHEKGEMTLEKAKELGAALLRDLRYGEDGYFWADTTEGVNVVLYGRPDTEGRNRLEDRDADGTAYVKAFLAAAKAGGGFVEYKFTKLGRPDPRPKRSYILPFEPFGWAVGTGYYLD